MRDIAPHLQIGRLGEQAAVDYLQNRGFKIIERNYRKKFGEIDIVAKRASVVHFVEVKASRYTNIGISPEENVHFKKQQRLHRAIKTYLMERNISESQEWQVDVVIVYLDLSSNKNTIEHIENVIFE